MNLTANQRTARRDPTRTTMLRQQYVNAARRRFRSLKALIGTTIIDNDALLLSDRRNLSVLQAQPARRYDWPSDPAGKAAAFMEWLQEAADDEILEITNREGRKIVAHNAWQDTYVRAGYGAGVDQASAELRRAGLEVPPYSLSGVFNSPMHADTLGLLFVRNFEGLKGITEAMSAGISRALVEGLALGLGPREVARLIWKQVDGIGIYRATLLARTEIIRAHAEATLNRFEEFGLQGVKGRAEWSTAGDKKVCELCKDLEGKEFTVQQARGMLPRHPNCLPGDALVTPGGRVTGASKRWYDGEMVVFRTASGKQLACTPNHPILTPFGWVAACLLDVGDNVICHVGGDRVIGLDDHAQNVPASIQEIADAFFASGNVTTKEVPVSSEDFHGDGFGSQVAVIGTNGLLMHRRHASFCQHASQDQLVVADPQPTLFNGFGGAQFGFQTDMLAAPSSVGMADQLPALFGREFAHPYMVGPALSAQLYSGFLQPIGDDVPGNVVLDGQGQNRRSGHVLANDLIGGQLAEPEDGNIVNADLLTGIFESASDGVSADAQLLANIGRRAARAELLDQIVEIEVRNFSGHVYNLETEQGFYAANGIITHNCRCAWLPVV